MVDRTSTNSSDEPDNLRRKREARKNKLQQNKSANPASEAGRTLEKDADLSTAENKWKGESFKTEAEGGQQTVSYSQTLKKEV